MNHNINFVLCSACVLSALVIGGMSMLTVTDMALRMALLLVAVLDLFAATYFFAKFYKSTKGL